MRQFIPQEILRDTEASNMVKLFPAMRHDFNAIARVRTAMNQVEYNRILAKQGKISLKRRLASIPRPLFVYLSQRMPELFQNPQLLKTYLRQNPQLLLVDKETI